MTTGFNIADYVYYDESSPTLLRRKVDGYRTITKAGEIAGGMAGGHSYPTVSIKNKELYIHRVVWELHNGPIPPGYCVDHINRNILDNRIANLRVATSSQNAGNTRRRLGKSGFRGVFRTRTGRWQAKIQHQGVSISLGVYNTPEEAAVVYKQKDAELRGEFAVIKDREWKSLEPLQLEHGYPSTYPVGDIESLTNWDTYTCVSW